MANPLAITPRASALANASGQSAAIDLGGAPLRKLARLKLEVTVVTGTFAAGQGLTVTVETGPASTGPWRSLAGWQTQQVHTQERSFGECDRWLRLNWTISGTDSPAFTFGVTGVAHVLYAAPSDVQRYSLPAVTLGDEGDSMLLDCCLAATDEADGYLNSAYTVPITSWGEDLTKHVSAMAAMDFLRRRGFQPEGPDGVVIDARDQAMTWLNRVAAGRLRPIGIVDSTPETYEGGAVVVSGASRGW